MARKRGRYQASRKPYAHWYKTLLPMLVLVAVASLFWQTSTSREKDFVPETVAKLTDSTAIPGFESLTLQADTLVQSLVLSNPPENSCLFRITLLLEDGTVLWTSDEIEPGCVSEPVMLSSPLAAGQYHATLKYECFTMDEEKSPMNGAEIKLTLRVKGSK